MSKHFKRANPSDKDLRQNPLIGGSKGTTAAGITPDELEEFEGESTFEGDVENDTNAQGGIDKPGRAAASRYQKTASSHKANVAPPRKIAPQGKKIHEQQLRTLQREADVPDARRAEAELERVGQDNKIHTPGKDARESEFPVSRGGLHQESDHNKHNRGGQSGHKPQEPEQAQEKH